MNLLNHGFTYPNISCRTTYVHSYTLFPVYTVCASLNRTEDFRTTIQTLPHFLSQKQHPSVRDKLHSWLIWCLCPWWCGCCSSRTFYTLSDPSPRAHFPALTINKQWYASSNSETWALFKKKFAIYYFKKSQNFLLKKHSIWVDIFVSGFWLSPKLFSISSVYLALLLPQIQRAHLGLQPPSVVPSWVCAPWTPAFFRPPLLPSFGLHWITAS